MQNTWTANVDQVSRSTVDIGLDATIDDGIMNNAEAAGFIDQLFKGVGRSGQSLKSFVESVSGPDGRGPWPLSPLDQTLERKSTIRPEKSGGDYKP